ncbi:hypothetical protein BD413DRAFT_472348, partial [Trametes elegans]
MEDTEEKPERQRDEVVWFEDGNVILVAQEVDAGLRIAECPVVHLTDSTKVLRHLLRMYMPSGGESSYWPENPTFDMLIALIRLGHKYQLPNLVQHSLDYLKVYFTDDFERWSEYEPGDLAHFQPAQAIGVVNVARLTGETSLLLTALLLCFTLGAGIVDGFERE